MELFLAVAIALMAGLLLTRLFKALGISFPDVTAFLLAGLLIGPYGLGRLGIAGLGFDSLAAAERIEPVSTAALGFIAFSIGSEFKLKDLARTGKTATVIGIFQAVCTTLLVDAALVALHVAFGKEVLPLSAAITLGAIASATAPAATLMVVRQFKADGPLTRLLLPIVALDDAVGLVLFSVSFGIARSLAGGETDLISILVNPLLEIVCSVALGALMGWILARLEHLFYSNSNRLAMTISFVFLNIALSQLKLQVGPVMISFSSLLVCMMLGTVFCNLCEFEEDIMRRAKQWTVPLNCVFFVLSGAELQLGVFSHIQYVLIGVIYIAVRSLGKYLGARLSAKACGCPEEVVKYLGITLLPQAGVALGMSAQALSLGGEEGMLIRNVTLFGVLIYELFGPSLTRRALLAAGEIKEKPADAHHRERFRNS